MPAIRPAGTVRPTRAARTALLVAFAILPALAACTPARLALPEGLATAEELPVSGRQGWKFNERVQFGSFQATDVQRSWTRGGDGSLGGRDVAVTNSNRAQEFGFRFEEGGVPRFGVACSAQLSSAGLDVRGVQIRPVDRSSLECELRPIGGGTSWQLALSESGERPLSGTLQGGGGAYQVRGSDRVQGGALPVTGTMGYHLLAADGRAVGAVQTASSGTVWLERDVPAAERVALSAAAAALLLLEELRATLDDEA